MAARMRDYLNLGVLLLVATASGLGIVSDLGHGAPSAHLLLEGAVMAGAFALLVWVVLDLRRQTGRVARLEVELEAVRQRAAQRSPELEQARERLGRAITAQFNTWRLSGSEQELGWLLLKGLSIKEIAALRSTHEKTVRQ